MVSDEQPTGLVGVAALAEPRAGNVADDELVKRYDALVDAARSAIAGERWEEALRSFETARELAESVGDERLADRAFVNECAMLIAIRRKDGLPAERLHRMREILMSGEDGVNCRLAAYNIARAYEFGKQFRKGLFYARIALDRSEILERRDWLASSHNQIGNLLLAESRFEDAREEYRLALSLLPDRQTVRRAAIHDNLGYTCTLLGRAHEGLSLLYRSLRDLVALGARRERIMPHLSLSFALIEVGRPRHAARHGAIALRLAEEYGEPDSIKQSLYLLGEAWQQAGDLGAARDHFQTLQERYFPDSSYLADFLLTVDVRQLINLKA